MFVNNRVLVQSDVISEFSAENNLLTSWADWVTAEIYVNGYGSSTLRRRSPGKCVTISDDLACDVDRAVAMTGPRYKRILKRWYLFKNYYEKFSDEREIRAALDEFSTMYHRLRLQRGKAPVEGD